MTTTTMRQWMHLMEDVTAAAPGSVEAYVAKFPESVSPDMETLMDGLRDNARDGSLFTWAIGKLNGRFINASASALKRWGIAVVKSGSSDDLI